jgi:hypothetical protein
MKATVKRKSGHGKRLKSLKEGRRDIAKAIKGASKKTKRTTKTVAKKSKRTTKSKPKRRSSKLATTVKNFATDAAKAAAVAAGKSVAQSTLDALSKQEQRGQAPAAPQGRQGGWPVAQAETKADKSKQ